jgi:D-arginine dehydrogenase
MMGNLADAVEVDPHDVLPEELDVAQAIFNLMDGTHLTIARPLST